MHILHIVASISPESGGPAELIRLLIRHAPPTDSAEVVTLDDPTAPYLRDFDFPIHALGTTPNRWYSPRLIPWLRANRHRFDAALIHGLWQYPGLAARLALKGHIPYAVFPHGMLDPWFKRDHLKHLKKQLYWLLAENWILRSAHRVLFTTQRERDLAAKTFWPSRWTAAVTPLGTEPPPPDFPFRSAAEEPASLPGTATSASTTDALAVFYQRCPGLKDKRFLLFVGRIDAKKGPDLLLRAFVDVCKHQYDLSLLMAGPSDLEYRRQLEIETFSFSTEGRIHWPGLLTGPAKWGALAACDAFILPSHQENFGIAVVEALASGKPVLISDQVNIAPEILADNCGLVEPDTLEGTRRLLQRWLALSPEEKTAMGERARTTFATRYDMRYNTAAILNIFKSKAN
jgi:glycosyltransferase involved in cell wall biosynthesis